MVVRQTMASHPATRGEANEALLWCIEQCHACAQACIACADACLAEPDVADLRRCIRLDLDCADICAAAGACATRSIGLNRGLIAELLNVCALVCRLCGDECERHAESHDHCRICAAACRRCAEACGEAIESLRR